MNLPDFSCLSGELSAVSATLEREFLVRSSSHLTKGVVVKVFLTPSRDYHDADPGDRVLVTVELTRRNLETLLAKLGDPQSVRTLIDPDRIVAVKAVDDSEHYSDRPPGPVYMPSTGERY